jgi:hypothetical protein
MFFEGVTMHKNPKQHEALLARREKQRIEGAVAMREYLADQEATRRKTKRLRELRLAREAAQHDAE